MQVFVDAMTCFGHGNIYEPTPFSVVNFESGTLGKFIEAVVGGAEKIQTPAPNRASVGEAILFNVLGQAERDIKDSLASLFVVAPCTFRLVEDQNGLVVGERRDLDLARRRVPVFRKPIFTALGGPVTAPKRSR
jgi:hypothetical protein